MSGVEPGAPPPPPAVVVVSFNTRDLLRTCLQAVVAEGAREIVVVDNGSSDGSRAMVREEFPGVRLLTPPENRGYADAANLGIAATTAPYVLLLNADTRVQPGALRALGRYLDENPRAGLVGPRLLNPDGTLQASCRHRPGPLQVLLMKTLPGRLLARLPGAGRAYLPAWSHDRPRLVPWLVGAALAIRRSAFAEVVGFETGYFMYFEEVDLCLRLAGAGWEVHFAPVAEVVHVEGASTRPLRGEMEARWFASAHRFHELHSGPAERRRLEAVLRLVLLERLVRDELRRRLVRDPERRHRFAEDARTWRAALERLGRAAA
jgi:GT2 family glycosyltransferase